MKAAMAVALGALLGVSILLAWVPQLWAVALLETGAFALAAAWAAQIALAGAPMERSPLLIPLLLTPAWGLAQLAAGGTVYARETWGAVLVWAALACVFFAALQSFAEERIRERFLFAALLFGFAVSLAWVLGVPSPFLSRNQYAAFIELLLPLALIRALGHRRGAIPYAVMAAAMYASVIASASRAGFALVSLEIAVIALVALRRRLASKALLVTVGLAAVFTVVVGWDVLAARLRQPDPYADRREMLTSTLAMIGERPFGGLGLGTWSTAYPAYALYDDGLIANQAHNDWAQWAAEGGLPFAALLVAFVAALARPAIRSLWGIGLLSVALHALVDYPFQKPALAALFFALAAALDRGKNIKGS